MCGEPYDQCTKEAFMKYLGVSNPAVPFPIYINLTNTTIGNMSYHNQSTFFCHEPVVSRYENKAACSCLVSERFVDEQELKEIVSRIVLEHVLQHHPMCRPRNLRSGILMDGLSLLLLF